jgi:hypothetical protein
MPGIRVVALADPDPDALAVASVVIPTDEASMLLPHTKDRRASVGHGLGWGGRRGWAAPLVVAGAGECVRPSPDRSV